MTPETKIAALLLLGLVGLEGAMRPGETRLSKDLAHIRSLETLADRFPGSEPSHGEKGGGVLVLGNSLARCAIDEELLREGLGLPDEETLAVMVPDATGVVEWAWGYRRHLLHRGARPRLVLLLTGRTHLLDPARPEIERLGAFHVGGGGDRRRFLREELGGFEERASFVLAGASRLYANRGRLRPLLFYKAMPGYTAAVDRINIAAGGGHAPRSEEQADADGGTRQLGLLIDSVRQSGADLVVVGVPLPQPWSLPDEVGELLAARQVPVIALGAGDTLPAERFPDGYHLDPEGAAETTRRLVEALRAQVGFSAAN
jgi:hypothetical protein